MKVCDTLIRCGHLLPIKDSSGRVLKDQALGISGGTIAFIEDWSDQAFSAREFIDARGKLVMPGLVNAHSHLPMSLFRGLADDRPFDEWLNKFILPLEAKLVSKEMVRLGTALSLLEGVSTGTTTFYDMYYFEDVIADVCDQLGVRAVVGETFIDFPVPDDLQKDGSDDRIVAAMAERFRGHPRIQPCVAPHAPYTCSDETLKRALRSAKKYDLPLGIHVSEPRFENPDSLKKYGKTSVKRLRDLGFFERTCIMAHGIEISDEDVSLMTGTGARVVYNPESNMKLGNNIAPIGKFLNAGIAVGLGTDGPASNNNLNMFTEMDFAAKLQKLASQNNSTLNANETVYMATLGGAKSLGLDHKVGSLEVGKHADLILIDLNLPHMKPLFDVCAQLVYAANGSEVRTVFCYGKKIYSDGTLQGLDVQDLDSKIEQFRRDVAKTVNVTLP